MTAEEESEKGKREKKEWACPGRRPLRQQRKEVQGEDTLKVGRYEGKERKTRRGVACRGGLHSIRVRAVVRVQEVRKRMCQRMSTPAWTRAEAKMELVLRQVQP
jgi:hypothetical protein